VINVALPERKQTTLHLFSGAGGGILADLLLGHRPICAVEIDPYCRQVLLARQADGCLPEFPIWDDVRTFDGTRWRGHVDIVAGGFPCQDISCAGKGAGITGERSGLWSEMARIIGEVRPRYVFVENSPLLIRRGLTTVLGDLAEMGFDAQWCCVSAENVGAPHRRDRIWIVANADSDRRNKGSREQEEQDGESEEDRYTHRGYAKRCNWWKAKPNVPLLAHGMAKTMDAVRASGNGQVSTCAALSFLILCPQYLRKILTEELCENVKTAELFLKRKKTSGVKGSMKDDFAMWFAQTLIDLSRAAQNIAEKG